MRLAPRLGRLWRRECRADRIGDPAMNEDLNEMSSAVAPFFTKPGNDHRFCTFAVSIPKQSRPSGAHYAGEN